MQQHSYWHWAQHIAVFPVETSPCSHAGHSSAWETLHVLTQKPPVLVVCWGLVLFVFLPLLYNSDYVAALKHWTASDTEDFLHATGDVSVGLNNPYPVMHRCTYKGQVYRARMAAVSGFQTLLNNTDIPNPKWDVAHMMGHYCKTNCLYETTCL